MRERVPAERAAANSVFEFFCVVSKRWLIDISHRFFRFERADEFGLFLDAVSCVVGSCLLFQRAQEYDIKMLQPHAPFSRKTRITR